MDNRAKATIERIFKSLFVATNLEDAEGLLKIGAVKNGIFARGAKRLRKYCDSNIYIHEDASGVRDKTISQLFTELRPEIYKRMESSNNIWTFRPYPWLDQFEAVGIEPIAWNYYLYTYWSSKFLQDKLLLKNADDFLESHIREKHKALQRRFVSSHELRNLDNNVILSRDFSTGGQGIFIDKESIELCNDFVLRSEKEISPHIPICQVAFTDGSRTITYPVSVMVIKTKEGHFNYLGSDFSAHKWINEEVQRKVSQLTRSIGKAISKPGFKGVYNCDYMYDPLTGEVYFAEVNPRSSGCSFLIDSAVADKVIKISDEHIYMMPSFLSFFLKQYGEIPEELNRNLSYEDIFGEDSFKSFSYIYANRDISCTGKLDSEHSPPENINVKKGHLLMCNCSNKGVIHDPVSPTTLVSSAEKYYSMLEG